MLLLYGLLIIMVFDQNLFSGLIAVFLLWSASEYGRYIYYRIRGKADEELCAEEYETDTIALENEYVVFGGKAGYDPISIHELDKLSYSPTDDDYQELTFVFKDNGGFVYSLNNNAEYISKAVELINKSLLLKAK